MPSKTPPNHVSGGAVDVNPARAAKLDQAVRGQLDGSFDHISEVLASRLGRDLEGITEFRTRLRAGPVSPWVFGLYSKLVAELSKNEADKAAMTYRDVTYASSLPAAPGLIELGEDAIASSWWDHYCLLLDTDRGHRFQFRPPRTEDAQSCRREVERAMGLLSEADPELHDELSHLLRMIVVGGSDSSRGFDGASTFFFWGAILLNAEARRDSIGTIDRLVHEASHVLLFGLSAAGPLTKNDGGERYASALRADARPIEGIFHACFVTTRVNLAIRRLLESRVLTTTEEKSAVTRLDFNGQAAQASLDTLSQHAMLTELGEEIYAELNRYWSEN